MKLHALTRLARRADVPLSARPSDGPAIGSLVGVHRNLHHGHGPAHFWSVRSKETGRVVGVYGYVELRGATWKGGGRDVAEGAVVAWDADRAPPRPAGVVPFEPTELPALGHADRLRFDREGMWMDGASAARVRGR